MVTESTGRILETTANPSRLPFKLELPSIVVISLTWPPILETSVMQAIVWANRPSELK